MKTKISIFPFIKLIGLAALILAVCCTGNDFGILVTVAVLSTLIAARDKTLFAINNLMLTGAVLGLIITHSVVGLVNTVYHKGPGFVDYGSGGYGEWGGLGGNDSNSEPDVEKVPESEYKQHEYRMNGMLLGLGLLLWFWVADYAKEVIPSKTNPKN